METRTRIYAKSITTTGYKIGANRNRVGLLAQNNSVNTLYVLSEGQIDTAQGIIVPAGAEYRSKHPQAAYNLVPDATSDVRIQEDVQVG